MHTCRRKLIVKDNSSSLCAKSTDVLINNLLMISRYTQAFSNVYKCQFLHLSPSIRLQQITCKITCNGCPVHVANNFTFPCNLCVVGFEVHTLLGISKKLGPTFTDKEISFLIIKIQRSLKNFIHRINQLNNTVFRNAYKSQLFFFLASVDGGHSICFVKQIFIECKIFFYS